MTFIVYDVVQGDIPRIVDILWSSMPSSGFLRAIGNMPNPDGQGDTLDPSVRREMTIARFTEVMNSSSTMRFLKAVEFETGEIVGFAIWHLFTGPEGLAEWKAQTEIGEHMRIPAGVNAEAYRYCWERINTKYRMVFGEGREHYRECISHSSSRQGYVVLIVTKRIDLSLLATDPAHQKCGAGQLLLNWGCQLADQHGLECHLEATPAGYPKCIKNGFYDALGPEESAIVFDVSQFTGRGRGIGDWVNMRAMIRPHLGSPLRG